MHATHACMHVFPWLAWEDRAVVAEATKVGQLRAIVAAEITADIATLTESESLIDIDTEGCKQTRGFVEIAEARELVGDSFIMLGWDENSVDT